MAHKHVRGTKTDSYVHFWFTNYITGKYIDFTVPDSMIEHACISTDNFCDVLESIIKKIMEEKFYEPGQR